MSFAGAADRHTLGGEVLSGVISTNNTSPDERALLISGEIHQPASDIDNREVNPPNMMSDITDRLLIQLFTLLSKCENRKILTNPFSTSLSIYQIEKIFMRINISRKTLLNDLTFFVVIEVVKP